MTARERRSAVWSDSDPDRLKRFRDMGIDAVNVTLMSETRDQLLPVLDRWAGHIRQLRV